MLEMVQREKVVDAFIELLRKDQVRLVTDYGGPARLTTTMFWKMMALTSLENDNAILIFFYYAFSGIF